MKSPIKSILATSFVCLIGATLMTGCYTVKGAFQGAGKDVSVLVGPSQPTHQHTYHTKTVYVSKKPVTKPVTVHKQTVVQHKTVATKTMPEMTTPRSTTTTMTTEPVTTTTTH